MANLGPTLPDHETCRHRWYGLTCEQFEDMLAACGRQCEACGCPSEEAKGGKLVIDHDGQVGNWAVRGLLCTQCNVTFRFDRPDPEWAKGYLDNPWYLRMLSERGIDPAFPEPTDWTVTESGHFIHPRVEDPEGRVWHRTEKGWTTQHKTCTPQSWRELLQRFGGHNLAPWHHWGEAISEDFVPGTAKGPSKEEYLAVVRDLSADEILDSIERIYKKSQSFSLSYEELIRHLSVAANRLRRKQAS